MEFTKITGKKFFEDMTSSNVIFIQGGYTSLTLDNHKWVQEIIEHCERIDIASAEKSRCVKKSRHLERILPDGSVSSLYFNDDCKHTFYAYKNIRIVEKIHPCYERNNYCIYLCV